MYLFQIGDLGLSRLMAKREDGQGAATTILQAALSGKNQDRNPPSAPSTIQSASVWTPAFKTKF
jgi:hypothetical protein